MATLEERLQALDKHTNPIVLKGVIKNLATDLAKFEMAAGITDVTMTPTVGDEDLIALRNTVKELARKLYNMKAAKKEEEEATKRGGR